MPLLEHKIGALDQAAPLAGWELPDAFPTLRRLLVRRAWARPASGNTLQVLRLVETFDLEVLHGAVKDALRLGAIGYDAVKHLVSCRIERRPPKLDLEDLSLPASGQRGDHGRRQLYELVGLEARHDRYAASVAGPSPQDPETADVPARIRQAGPPMRHRGRRPCAVSCPSDRVGTRSRP